MKLSDLEKLNKLQEELLLEALLLIEELDINWNYYEINLDSSGGYHKFDYFVTRFKTGYLLIIGNEMYFSLEKYDYNWNCLKEHVLFLGEYNKVGEVFHRLLEIYDKSRFLN